MFDPSVHYDIIGQHLLGVLAIFFFVWLFRKMRDN